MKTSISPLRSIITRYLGPTDCRGTRIVADAGKGARLTMPYDHALNTNENHAEAAKALCLKMGWDKVQAIYSGGHESGVYVHVLSMEV